MISFTLRWILDKLEPVLDQEVVFSQSIFLVERLSSPAEVVKETKKALVTGSE